MERDNRIPIMIGVTGHRSIRKEEQDAIYQAVRAELEKLKQTYPDSPFCMLSSLAEGGDLLCAEAAYELKIPILAALPVPMEVYEKDFSAPARERLHFHCKRAEDVFVVPAAEPEPEQGISRDYLFRQAGIYVASHSHILLAVWDGGPGTAAACGTAAAVDFALHGNYRPSSGIPVRSGDNAGVVHIFSPRGEQAGEAAGTVHYLGNRERLADILEKTDHFNRQAKDIPVNVKSAFPGNQPERGDRQDEQGKPAEDPILDRLDEIRQASDKLSLVYAGRYRRALALLAAASMILTFAFLMYDEAEAIWMILVCGIMLLGAWACQRYASRSECHRLYIEYRSLSESLRVQYYVRYAGTAIETASLLTWTQQKENAWIMDALCSLAAGKGPETGHDIRDCWVEDQRNYHQWAGKRSRHNLRGSEAVVRTALACSIALYLAAVLFEFLCGGLIFRPVFPIQNVEWYRTWLKIILGTISAVTLFISNYYGKQSLTRTCSDHEKMERFYAKMSSEIARWGQTEELLTVLAREELIENGNWCSYQRDNTPDMSL